MRTTSFVSAVLALAGSAAAQSSVAALVASLREAPTQVDRIRMLNDSDYLFNFLAPPSGVTTGAGGHTVAASSENFPAVIGNGVSMTIGFLGPCGMNTPHTHPRATEINFSLNTTLRAGFLAENGARFVEIELAPGSATVFPQGAIHFEMNPSCEPAMFVAGFNGEDPGVQQQAQRYFGLPPDIVGATLNGLGVEEVFGLESMIPDNVALGAAECLQRCGLTAQAQNQPTTQRQPRVPGNAYPSGIGSASIPAPTVYSASPSASASASYYSSYASYSSTPASYSSAPASYSSAPTPYSSTPASYSSAPYSSAPASYSSAPASYSSAPYSSAPASYSSAPASYSSAPASYSSAPAPYSSAPASYSSAPASYSSAPASYSSAPASYSSTPASYSSAPASYSSAPASYSSYSYSSSYYPSYSYSAPAASYSAPVAASSSYSSYYYAASSGSAAPSSSSSD